MKTQIKFFSVAFMVWLTTMSAVSAQNYDTIDLDTIPARYPKYHYTEWYDECPISQSGGLIDSFFYEQVKFLTQYSGPGGLAKYEYTDHPIQVRGIVALVSGTSHAPYILEERRPEYLYLIKRIDYEDTILTEGPLHHYRCKILDSVRFDTLIPKVMELTQPCELSPLTRCYAFEAYFKSPIIIDSGEFYLYGSSNSTKGGREWDSVNEMLLPFQYKPVEYLEVITLLRPIPGSGQMPNYIQVLDSLECHAQGEWHTKCFSSDPNALSFLTWLNYPYTGDPWIWDDPTTHPYDPYGLFLPIVYHYQLDVYSDDEAMGSAVGGGFYDDYVNPEIRAIPNEGYAFRHWNDGSTENPRTIILSQDTAFTAYFSPIEYYTVEVNSNNSDWGTVEGGGVYCEQTETVLTAQPAPLCYFEQWNDGDWHNPRTITVTQDTVFTAKFVRDPFLSIPKGSELYFNLAPNPTGKLLTITFDDMGPAEAEVYDNRGICMMRLSVTGPQATIDVSSLPVGHYTLRLTKDTRIGVRRFVKE
ncbi:MAG: T9SS type A sorting domain-containing protein [Bacteroidales bacterium]|nr:T9SS type A sorting domain-containing protein [Bacteroidales bacterium]